VLPTGPVYGVPAFGVHASQIIWALLVGPLAGLAAIGWVRLVGLAHRKRPRGWGRLVAPIVVLSGLGAIAVAYPQLLGNGKDTVELAFAGSLGLGVVVVLAVLKPLVTGACLGSGAPGGLFTPTLTYGVLLGAFLGHVWTLLWPGASVGSYAVIGGGAVLAASMQAPLAAVVLVLELTHRIDSLMVPLLLAVIGATVVARRTGSASIYSARLGARTYTVGVGPISFGSDGDSES
jgi:H+/Cl- antiporter ClcA